MYSEIEMLSKLTYFSSILKLDWSKNLNGLLKKKIWVWTGYNDNFLIVLNAYVLK